MDLFWTLHDATSWDRQGADEGEEYRCVIFATPEQLPIAEASMEAATAEFDDPIVTELRALEIFWVAEDDQQRA